MVVVTSFTEPGQGHRVNQDAFIAQPHPADPTCWVCVLADGQGGRSGAAEAAQVACKTVAEAVSRVPPPTLMSVGAWEPVLKEADKVVEADAAAGTTTLTAFCIREGFLVGSSCGDSAVLVVSAGQPKEVTTAQPHHPVVGSGAAEFVPFSAKLTEPWVVLAMSDGVWKYAGWDTIIKVAKTLSGAALVEHLKQAARSPRDGRFPDDFTVVVCEGTAG